MKRLAKIISSLLLLGTVLAVFTACERIDIEGIGELNKIELWYGPYTNDAPPLPDDGVLIDLVEKDLGISLKAVPLPSNKEEQQEMIMEAALSNSLPDILDRKPCPVIENKTINQQRIFPFQLFVPFLNLTLKVFIHFSDDQDGCCQAAKQQYQPLLSALLPVRHALFFDGFG